jgi:dipeptidyl aminopeptidase/acylaminoacyl peptidase
MIEGGQHAPLGELKMPTHHRTPALALLASLALTASCVDLMGPNWRSRTPGSAGIPSDTTPAPPVITAVVRIATSTTGVDPDSDGYTVILDPQPDVPLAAIADSGIVEMRLPVGTYIVRLDGVADNCAVEAVPWWGTLREVRVRAGADADITFPIACDPIPTARLAPGDELAFVRDGQIWRVSSDGTGAVPLTSGPGDSHPSWSPDGQRIAFARDEGWDDRDESLSAIYVMDADGSNLIRLSQRDSYDREPAWSPDGRRIAYASRCADSPCVVALPIDPADGSRMLIGSSQPRPDSPAWSPDGTRIAFTSGVRDGIYVDPTSDVYLASVGGTTITRITPLGSQLESPRNLYFEPAWSPDGARLALTRCPDHYWLCDVSELAVVNADGTGMSALASTRGGSSPSWSPNERTIAFTRAGSIQWISADGSARGIIVENGGAPAWRPK